MPRLGIVAVSWVDETKLVLTGEPESRTLDPRLNPEPLTVRVKGPKPALTLLGEMDEIMGLELEPPMLNETELERIPPSITEMDAVPDAVSNSSGTVEVNSLVDSYAVERGNPSNMTVDTWVKLEPKTVRRVVPEPTGVELGEIELMVVAPRMRGPVTAVLKLVALFVCTKDTGVMPG